MRANSRRITIDLGQSAWDRINKLQEVIEGGTKTAVIASALQLFEYMAEQSQRGSRFFVCDERGNTESIQIFGLPRPFERCAGEERESHRDVHSFRSAQVYDEGANNVAGA